MRPGDRVVVINGEMRGEHAKIETPAVGGCWLILDSDQGYDGQRRFFIFDELDYLSPVEWLAELV